jgi:quercetin dioxygenase-like cupin family protein
VDVLLVGLEGEAQLKVGERTILLQNGQVLQIPALVPHSLTALRNFKMLLIK